jgi:hypothetical protein
MKRPLQPVVSRYLIKDLTPLEFRVWLRSTAIRGAPFCAWPSQQSMQPT